MKHFNRLTPTEAERLALLAEELGEAIQAVGKVLRHGYENSHPDSEVTNRQHLERELGDAYHAVVLMCSAGDLSVESIASRADEKAKTAVRHLHHQTKRRQAGDLIWKIGGFGMSGGEGLGQIRPGSEPDDFACVTCGDPDCREWPDVWVVAGDGTPTGDMWCHVSECGMQDPPTTSSLAP